MQHIPLEVGNVLERFQSRLALEICMIPEIALGPNMRAPTPQYPGADSLQRDVYAFTTYFRLVVSQNVRCVQKILA